MQDEGRAYYSTGVLSDNLGKYKQAIEHYQKFLQVCKAIGDVHGEALAYNCIGVDFQKLAETEPKHYKDAIEYHLKHKEIADVAGKFLAHVNLGIIYASMGDTEKASINHQFALRYAIQMSSVAGQSVAIGNLGDRTADRTLEHDVQCRSHVFRFARFKLPRLLHTWDVEVRRRKSC